MTTSEAITAPDTTDENAAIDQDDLSLDELARAVIERRLRLRVGSVRRLAEGVLARAAAPAKAKKPKKSKETASKKGGGKKRKLARIPGQKAK